MPSCHVLQPVPQLLLARAKTVAGTPSVQEYEYKGRLVGAFFSEDGFPTALSKRMWEGSARHKAAMEERKNKKLGYPDCNSRWSSSKGATEIPIRLTGSFGWSV